MGSVPVPEEANVSMGISSYPWVPAVGVLISMCPETSPLCGTSTRDGSVNAGFVKFVLLITTFSLAGVMSNTAGVVVAEDVTSKPLVPENVGMVDPELIMLESSNKFTMEGSDGPTGSITTGGLAGTLTSTTVPGRVLIGTYPVRPPVPDPVPMPRPPKYTPRLPHCKMRSAKVVPSTLGITSGGHVPEALQVL